LRILDIRSLFLFVSILLQKPWIRVNLYKNASPLHKKKTIFKAPPSPFQYLGRAWGESKGPIGTFQDLYVAPKGAFECLFGGLKLIKCAVYL